MERGKKRTLLLYFKNDILKKNKKQIGLQMI